MALRTTPPYSGPSTPAITIPSPNAPASPPANSPPQKDLPKRTGTAKFPSINSALFETDLTQPLVTSNPPLQRLQQDLLILTSLNENETLHWRPSWFKQGPFSETFWTLYNPPDVVTEFLPQSGRGRKYFTRRMRRDGDPPPFFIKSWDAWTRYCRMYGIPWNFLCQEHVELLRMGLRRDAMGRLLAPPVYPLYPEPQPLGRGRYILDPATYRTHLPAKFHFVNHDADAADEARVVVVHSTGALTVELRGPFFMHASQWTHFNGNGGYQLDLRQNFDETAPRQQGPGQEQEESCQVKLVVKLKVGGAGKKKGDNLLRALLANK